MNLRVKRKKAVWLQMNTDERRSGILLSIYGAPRTEMCETGILVAMYKDIRVVMVLLSLALAAIPAWVAGSAVLRNFSVLKSWKRAEGVVMRMPAADYVELEIGVEPDTRRVVASPDHQLGLSLFHKVPVFLDPSDPGRVRVGGLLQLWLWPTALVLAAVVLVAGGAGASRLGLAGAASVSDQTGRWMFSPPPPPLSTDIRVYRPGSEWRAPLVWSLLGAAALACGLFVTSGGRIPRMCLGAIGVVFMLLMWALSVDHKTTEISADHDGMRKTSAFGWCQIRWEQVGSVERQELALTNWRPRLGWDLPFPGRTTTSVVFADRSGRTLILMSDHMQPGKTMLRLLDLCAERTGLRMEFRRIYTRNM